MVRYLNNFNTKSELVTLMYTHIKIIRMYGRVWPMKRMMAILSAAGILYEYISSYDETRCRIDYRKVETTWTWMRATF